MTSFFFFFLEKSFRLPMGTSLKKSWNEKKRGKAADSHNNKKILLACCTGPDFNLSPPGSLSTQQGAKTCSDQVEVQSASFISVLDLKKKSDVTLLANYLILKLHGLKEIFSGFLWANPEENFIKLRRSNSKLGIKVVTNPTLYSWPEYHPVSSLP